MTGVRPWWPEAVGYQIYLPSFQDSDGDGWGDLRGVTQRLDYLVELGVSLIWLTPFYRSPMRDHGYDISDYLSVDPRYGTIEDLDELLDQAHRRGVRVIADLVVNHTSTEHPWFVDSRSARSSSCRDYYIWRDPAPDGSPPNNWLSHFGGPAWTLDEQTGQYYLHLFTPGQPDLNWENPQVAEEVDGVLKYWLERGFDGFRVDTAHYLTKHPDLPDNPLLPVDRIVQVSGVTSDWLAQDHLHDIAQPTALAIHRRWRAIAAAHDAMLVGEIPILDPVRLASYLAGDGLDAAFWFGLVESGWDPPAIRTAIAAAAQASPRLAWFQSNHDRSRAVTRYGGGDLGRSRAMALTTLLMALPGIPFLYNGDELGLADGTIPAGAHQDPLAQGGSFSRDGARTPMPWTAGPGLGFTSAREAWLPFGARTPADTVAHQRQDPNSSWSTTARLLRTRTRLLRHLGTAPVWLDQRLGVIACQTGTVVAAANLTDDPRPLDLPAGAWISQFDTGTPSPTGVPAQLQPYQAVIARLDQS